ncbi:dihydrodipicolinate synthase [Xylogone sp. PMI_703]|nr:dihydrodipicolinate synthase [Xylogone sp. PMI_703]
MPSPPTFGVYPPVVTFFKEDETVDYPAASKHLERLIKSGVTGLVIHGSNGESSHLLHDERAEIIAVARKIAQQEGKSIPIIAGCSAPSVRETLIFIEEAKQAGADYALVLPPSFWPAVMSKPVIKSFYTDVAAKSVLPIIIYNFPTVTAGIDLDSDQIADIASSSSNIVGVKLSCGDIGKAQRLSSTFDSSRFAVFGGRADFLLPGLFAGSSGAIAVLANVVPKALLEVIRLYKAGQIKEAQDIQAKLAHADWTLKTLGISGTKVAIQKYFGYGNPRTRTPFVTVDEGVLSVKALDKLQAVIDVETKL